MNRIVLKLGKAKPFLNDEPLVFSGAIQKVIGNPAAAELVEVCTVDQQPIGVGVYNPYSNYRVRLLAKTTENLPTDLMAILTYRLQQAINFRHTLDLPNTHTNAYRLVNSEGDGLSGLTIDVFADYCVASVTAYWLMLYKEIVLACLEKLGFSHVIWRPQIKALEQDGWRETHFIVHDSEKMVTIQENDIMYQADIGLGQKTGFYCDQRQNRLVIRSLAKDRKVLDCFCYTGGFALNAAYGGAKKVVGIESSAPAIAQAQHNAKLNQLNHITFSNAKAEDILSSAIQYDMIILDPPKLAPSKQHLPRATQRYLKLNQLALTALPKNGLLFTCSCSNAMTQTAFLAMVHNAAKKVNRKIEILQQTGAAPDHRFLPRASYGNYLKAVLVRVKN